MVDGESKIMNIFSKEGLLNKSQFKIVRYILVIVLLGVLLLMMGDFASEEIEQGGSSNKEVIDGNNHKNEIEKKLATSLSRIQGVGEVSVDISFDSGSEYIYARDEHKNLNRSESDEGKLKNSQKDINRQIVVLKKRGDDEALLKKEIKPQIRGVLVVAQGAENMQTKAQLIEAIKVGLGVPSYKIAVLPKER